MSAKKDEAQTAGASAPAMTVQDAVKVLGPDFMRDLIDQLTPIIRRAVGGNVRKEYEVEPFLGSKEVVEQVRVPILDNDGVQVTDDKGKKQFRFEPRTRTVTGGYMVYLPQGHCIYVESAARLQELKLDAPSGLVDMTTGLAAIDDGDSIKDAVRRNTQHTPRARRSGDGSLAGSIDSVIRTLE